MSVNEATLLNLQDVLERVAVACQNANRSPEDVRLLLATKTVSAARIKAVLESGQILIGENKVQEIKEKYEALKDTPHELHFIGHLQTNKIKDILKYGVTCVQSIDRLELAEKLHHRLLSENRKMDILIQVNTSDEESKFGIPPEHALDLVKNVAALSSIRIRGLMTIGLFSTHEDKVNACFQRLKGVQNLIKAANLPNVEMKELSMGMSNDLEIAIAAGATIVRVGTAVFGERKYPDSYYWNEQK